MNKMYLTCGITLTSNIPTALDQFQSSKHKDHSLSIRYVSSK